MENDFDILKNIKLVNAPDFLFTRIISKIENRLAIKISKGAAISWSVSLVIVVIVNVTVLLSQSQTTKQETMIESMNLLPDNNLYE